MLTEKRTRLSVFRDRGWRVAALTIAPVIAILGLGNGFVDDGGPLYGRIGYASLTVIGLGLVIAGLVVRQRRRGLGSTMVGVGLAPGFVMTLMFWFPPVALLGVFSIVVAVFAFRDAVEPVPADSDVLPGHE